MPTDDLNEAARDTSRSCVFDYPDRPVRPVPPTYPPSENPPPYPYEPWTFWGGPPTPEYPPDEIPPTPVTLPYTVNAKSLILEFTPSPLDNWSVEVIKWIYYDGVQQGSFSVHNPFAAWSYMLLSPASVAIIGSCGYQDNPPDYGYVWLLVNPYRIPEGVTTMRISLRLRATLFTGEWLSNLVIRGVDYTGGIVEKPLGGWGFTAMTEGSARSLPFDVVNPSSIRYLNIKITQDGQAVIAEGFS